MSLIDQKYIEEVYNNFKKDSLSVPREWQDFFKGFEFAKNSIPNNNFDSLEVNVLKLINAYRARGHLISKTNPVRERKKRKDDLDLEYFNLSEKDLNKQFSIAKEITLNKTSLHNIIEHLKKTYCSSIGVEYRSIPNSDIRQWLYDVMEPVANQPYYNPQEKITIFENLVKAVNFEKFLHKKYVGQKRFSLEGLESVIPGLNFLLWEGANLGAKEFIFGMAHRGRINILTNVFQKRYETIFREFEGSTIDANYGDSDVKYHLGQSADIIVKNNLSLHVSLIANPSHLEAVNPVILGSTRAKFEQIYNKNKKAIVPILIHGDAAIAGQGIVYETVNMANLEGYETHGTIHIIFNNQVGFTANYNETRSSDYCTDIAKVMSYPIFHVNADDPIAVITVMKIAIMLRQQFNIDVYVDILGYRRYGHNEGDEPKFTQPLLYKSIEKHPSVLDIFKKQLIKENILSNEKAQEIINNFDEQLETSFEKAKKNKNKNLSVDLFQRNWRGFKLHSQRDFEYSIITQVEKKNLDKIINKTTLFPKSFNKPIKKLENIIQQRKINYLANKIDWATAEILAYGSILIENIPIRLSGQDCRRGTFSHRHSTFIDPETEQTYVFLNHIQKKQEKFQVFNSHLSEYGVLGFEYGYAMARPKGLTIWEAQFGDFSNGAQIIIDQFISSAQTKWQRFNGITLFLPHGYEGQGPEHSSARLERFLILAAENNMYIINPTTPANFFHALRRQVKNDFRIPLIIMTPKSLLRNPEVISTITDFTQGKFQEIIDDKTAQADKVKRVILCSGKIFYELNRKREELKADNVAIIRIEQFYPIPKAQDKKLVSKYKNAKEWYWVQEEPSNMGGWYFIRERLSTLTSFTEVVSRKKSASPAHGSSKKEAKSQEKILETAFSKL